MIFVSGETTEYFQLLPLPAAVGSRKRKQSSGLLADHDGLLHMAVPLRNLPGYDASKKQQWCAVCTKKCTECCAMCSTSSCFLPIHHKCMMEHQRDLTKHKMSTTRSRRTNPQMMTNMASTRRAKAHRVSPSGLPSRNMVYVESEGVSVEEEEGEESSEDGMGPGEEA